MKQVTSEEFEEMTKNDVVVAFIDRVNDMAVEDPLWNENFAAAHYKAFCKCAGCHITETYGLIQISNPNLRV